MLEPFVIKNLREKYSNVHPLIFRRSLEKAKSNGELFDILSTIPENFPIIWSEKDKRWVFEKDLYLTHDFFKELP